MPRGVYDHNKRASAKINKPAKRSRKKPGVPETYVIETKILPDPTTKMLSERQGRHGNWQDNARVSRRFKEIIHAEIVERITRDQIPLSDSQREALEMIAHKMGRIISGDPAHSDHWDDIEGYARLGNKGHQ